MNDSSGITVEEMCSRHLTSPEDYSRSCNPDGTVKTHSTTKITVRNDPSHPFAVNNVVLFSLIIAAICALAVTAIILAKRQHRTK